MTPLRPLDLPKAQSFRVWPADATEPAAAAGAAEEGIESPIDDADLVAAHEMWLCGPQFLTIRYGLRGEKQS